MIDKLAAMLDNQPMIDVHTHIDTRHPTARGLHDVLLYHMMISELYSAGCPDGERLPEEPDDDEIHFRIVRALPYLNYIQNTGIFWCFRTILEDLYSWYQPVTLDNWESLHKLIKEKSQEPNRALDVLDKAHIKKFSTELWRQNGKPSDLPVTYSMEWAFFFRCQWLQYDTALFELENTWNQPGPQPPLPVTIGNKKLELKRVIRTLSDVNDALDYYCDKTPFEQISSIAQHFSTDICYREVTDKEMEEALKRRGSAGEHERDIYASYITERYLSVLNQQSVKPLFIFSLGAEPLPLETGSKLTPESIYGLSRLIYKHSGINFMLLSACAHQNQALCSLARELPNITLGGYWWHSFTPGFINSTFKERLDMLPLNRHVAFFSDSYCVEWAYAKAFMVRKQAATVLDEKIRQGQYSFEVAEQIVHQVFYETANNLL